MKALILGGGGFVGRYLIDALHAAGGYDVCVTKLARERLDDLACPVYDLDLLEEGAAAALLERVQPDVIFHLAAQSSVALSWKAPVLTADINIGGTLRLLEAVRQLSKKPRILLIGSGEEYGAPRGASPRFDEEAALHPGNIYAATKACQGMLGEIYAKAYGLDIVMIRAFNHIGPGQAPQFVVSDFCKQVASIERGLQPPLIRTGNLAAKRDFTDVRDVMRAYVLLAAQGKAGETYNVGSGSAVAISDILAQILTLAEVPIASEIDPARLRPVDVPEVSADITRLQRDTGWKPQYSLAQTLRDTLAYWRSCADLS